jgi:uracil phosphoribosyltransferase
LDKAYRSAHYTLSELPQHYGENVHLLGDPLALTQLARLCAGTTQQPDINRLVASLYQHLFSAVINQEFPRRVVRSTTRMISSTPRAVLEGEMLDTSVRVVCVDIARAGILPSQICYDLSNSLFDPANVRQDHLIMSRVTDGRQKVTGADIVGGKVGGSIDGRYVLLPDPMGATGTSLATAISRYKSEYGSQPAKVITMSLIVTPQFIRTLRDAHPDVVIYALRLDRGMSEPAVLATELGERWEEESGLNDVDYIVPGGGGFGEIMNNSFV